MTADAIYREYDADLSAAKANGCDIVNCDSSHLYAVSHNVGLHSMECGIISDVALTLAGKIVEFYVEVLLSELG